MSDIPTLLTAISLYVIVFLYGITIGSFVNVLICRIPRKENFVKIRSHCESCGYELRWFDLIPLFSYICLRGKCRKCKAKISIQHLLIEVLNGLLYVVTFWRFGLSVETLVYCLMFSALLGLSMIDFKTYEIPFGFNVFIFVLGCVKLCFRLQDWKEYVIGFFAVSVFLYLLFLLSRGAAIGGGDVKLMAVCGLVIGWKLIIFAFILGCIIGSVIHILRMKLSGEDHVLAMGPYLSVGVLLAVFFGDRFLSWYLGILSFGM